MAKDRAGYQCSRFCFGQAHSCLKLARFHLSPWHRHRFIQMARDWKRFAERCGGQRGMWPTCVITTLDPAWQQPQLAAAANIAAR